MKKDRSDFRNWLSFNGNWEEVAFQINTGRQYQHKQDLISVFWNGYIYYQQKFEGYFKEFNKIPLEVFDELVFEFRQSFPKHGRTDGVNYFDDLLEQLIEHYSIEEKAEHRSYRVSNLVKDGQQIENSFLKNDEWTLTGKYRGTEFIRMLESNINKLLADRTCQFYLQIAKAHNVQVSDKSIRNVMKEGRKVELKRNKSGT